MPSIGRLYKYEEPGQLAGVRCDSGIEEGSEISVYYDPMICKLTCYGGSRDEAINTSVAALDHYVIRGVTHNIPLLRDVLTEPVFQSGVFTTRQADTPTFITQLAFCFKEILQLTFERYCVVINAT